MDKKACIQHVVCVWMKAPIEAIQFPVTSSDQIALVVLKPSTFAQRENSMEWSAGTWGLRITTRSFGQRGDLRMTNYPQRRISMEPCNLPTQKFLTKNNVTGNYFFSVGRTSTSLMNDWSAWVASSATMLAMSSGAIAPRADLFPESPEPNSVRTVPGATSETRT